MLIDAEGLTKLYKMGSEDVYALDDVSVEIDQGEFVAILGPSGSGKTTLMNILGLLDSPTGGTYRLKGDLVSEMGEDDLAAIRNREIGFIFQTFNLLADSTTFHNVQLPMVYSAIPRETRRERALSALDRVGLADRIHHKPNELSGGQRQRVAIARALVNEPSILLADEPTGNLDTTTGEEIMRLLGEIHAGGGTILLVTHDENVARHARRWLIMRDGKVVEDRNSADRRQQRRPQE